MAEVEDVDAGRVGDYAAAAWGGYPDKDDDDENTKKWLNFEKHGYMLHRHDGMWSNDPQISGWLGGGFRDKNTGASARVFTHKRGEVVISFAGTDEGKDCTRGDWPTRGMAQYWAMDNAVREAVEYAKDKGWKVVFTGHSLGGYLAQMYAIKHGKEGYAFNSGDLTKEQISVALQDRAKLYGEDLYGAPQDNIIKVNTHNDPLSADKGVKRGRQYYVAHDSNDFGHPIEKVVQGLDNGPLLDEEGVKEVRRQRGQELFRNFDGWVK